MNRHSGSAKQSMTENKPLIIITGPTAVGKTELSIMLAKKINGEIVSADSMQVYKGMDIGTAKISKSEMSGVPHHLIDCLDIHDEFSVYTFKQLAEEAICSIYEHDRIPIICGGTGFFIQAVLYDIDFNEEQVNAKLRSDLYTFAEKYGRVELHNRLKRIDPDYARDIHFNNIKRVVRAIEYYEMTGQRFSEHNVEQHARSSSYDFRLYCITDNKDSLYKRIDTRVDKMIQDGLYDEVTGLIRRGARREDVSMQGIGYKEIIDAINGKCTLDEAVEKIKINSRHYAKKQITWFKRERDVEFIDRSNYNDTVEIMNHIYDDIVEHGII